MIKIAIVEDNFSARMALEEKLSTYKDISIIHRSENGEEIIQSLENNASIDIIFMDIEMPKMNGIEATTKIKLAFPNIKIIIITIHDDDENIFNAIKAGADSYILKETKAEKIYETIQDTLQGGAIMSPSIAMKALSLLKNAPADILPSSEPTALLTQRETEILTYLSQGMTNKVIAEQLIISPFTVKRHLENIYQKLQVHNRIGLINQLKKTKT